MDGGGNDLHDDCGCEACELVLDGLVSDDGRSGEIPDFVRRLLDDGPQVMVVGYYEIPSDARYGFDRCADKAGEHGSGSFTTPAAQPKRQTRSAETPPAQFWLYATNAGWRPRIGATGRGFHETPQCSKSRSR